MSLSTLNPPAKKARITNRCTERALQELAQRAEFSNWPWELKLHVISYMDMETKIAMAKVNRFWKGAMFFHIKKDIVSLPNWWRARALKKYFQPRCLIPDPALSALEFRKWLEMVCGYWGVCKSQPLYEKVMKDVKSRRKMTVFYSGESDVYFVKQSHMTLKNGWTQVVINYRIHSEIGGYTTMREKMSWRQFCGKMSPEIGRANKAHPLSVCPCEKKCMFTDELTQMFSTYVDIMMNRMKRHLLGEA